MTTFVFDDEVEEDEEEFLDLSDLEEDEEEEPSRGSVSSSTSGEFSFEDDIPQAMSLVSEEVKARARSGRKRGPAKMDFYGKTRDLGWSFYCAHKDHLPTLCERGQNNGEVTCACPCHAERGFVFPQSQPVSGSDDEEFILLIG
jgi:hypothetical protein